MGKKAVAPAEAAPAVEEAVVEPSDDQPGEVLEGDFAWPDGSEYIGEYVMKKDTVILHGTGCLRTGPEVFSGTFEDGLYKEGTFQGADGSVYKGGFRNNLFEGPGEYTWADGRVYRGLWQEGMMHGRGEFENFSFGVDRVFTGFCVRGQFSSSIKGQDAAKRDFLVEYGGDYSKSALAALRDVGARARAAPAEPVDPKAKKVATEDGPAGIPEEYLILPVAGAEDGASADEAIAQLVEGPFPDGSTVKASALGAFVGRFAEGAENLGHVTVLDSRSASVGGFSASRLRKEQLGHAGQAVAFSVDDAEPGALCLAVFLNIRTGEYSAKQATWKLIHCENAPDALA